MLALLEYDEPYAKCRKQINKLRKYIKKLQKDKFPIIDALQHRANMAKDNDELYTMSSKRYQFDTRCSYSHWGKIYDIDFSSCSDRIVSASQDGKLLIGSTKTANKLIAIPLRSAYVNKCSFAPNDKFVASGGLDNLCSVFNIEGGIGWEVTAPVAELQGHEGYVSGVEFVDDNQIMTGSGDANAILWDIERQKAKKIFEGHNGELHDISIHSNKSVFITASFDGTAKIWDIRGAKAGAIYTFRGHDCDLNCCRWFPNGHDFIFATGGDDDTIRLWDWRSKQQLNIYEHAYLHDCNYASAHSIDFSKSGYYLFAGYDTAPYCIAWNTMTGEKEFELEHPTMVTSVRVSPDGYQIATGCWDRNVRFWSMSV